MTITIMKTTKGRVCGGYLHIAWKYTASAECGNDPSAFLFSLDHRRKFTPPNAAQAVYFNMGENAGPYFMNSLGFP
jgi:hypothetical protein